MNATSNPAREIFLAAIELPSPEERAAFLDRSCEGDAELRARVERLLQSHELLGTFHGSAAFDSATINRPVTEMPGDSIGPYKLLQQIGEGGMGVVFMAEQTEPIQRTVALKIIKPGMDTRQVIARFEAERQALAVMDHPNIAKVLDAGTTETGRPYFVMEMVKGVPITKYCDDHKLSLRERLELFKPVCEAVQHAHQKGIIHRDLKPTNVLVAEYDNRAVPKIIDFGVAKATAQKLTERTMFTEFGQVIGTVEYMSPEQAKLNQLDIDTRSDIYSLGVLLYELLTGSTPFDRQRLRSAAFDEVLRIIRDEEPPMPSTRLRSSANLPSLAANRNSDPIKLSGQIRGELDWIVMKALDKERSRRYETANGLAMDIERFINDEIVTARPASTVYRLRKLVRRNRVAFAMATAIAAVIVLGSVVSTWQAIRATRSENEQTRLREIADMQRAEAEKQRSLATAAAERERDAAQVAQQARDAAVEAQVLTKMQLADNYASRGSEESEMRINGRSVLWFANAAVTSIDDPKRVQANLLRVKNWGRGQLTPAAAFKQPVDSCDQLMFSPVSSRFLITTKRLGTNDVPAQIWDLATEQPLPMLSALGPLGDAAWAPDGKVILGNSRGQVLLASIPELNPLQQWDAGGAVRRVAASPNGQFVAATSRKKLLVWNTLSSAEPAVVEHAEAIVHIAFSPSGEHLVTATDDDATAHLFQVEKNAAASPQLRPVLGPVPHIYRGRKGADTDWFTRPPVFVDGGRQLVTIHSIGAAGEIKWYDTASGATLATTKTPINISSRGVAVSPDGNLFVVAGTQTAETTQVFDVKTRQMTTRLGNALRLAFSPNGRYFASSGTDLEVRTVQPGQIGSRVFPYLGKGGSAAFSHDGRFLALLTKGLTHIWELPKENSLTRRFPHGGRSSWGAFSPDGCHVASVGKTSGTSTVRTIQVRETETGQPAGQPLALDANLVAADFSPNGELMAAVTGAGDDTPQLRIWNWRTGSLVGEPFGMNSEPVSTRFAPDGKAVAVHCMDGQAFLVDSMSGKQLLHITCKVTRQRPGTFPYMAGRGTIGFSHDGKTLFTWGSPVVQAWERDTGRERWAAHHPVDCWALAESPDGRLIATGSFDTFLRFWEAETGNEARSPIEHPDQLLTVTFSPDGRLIGTSNRDSHSRVWDVITGNLAHAMFSPDYLTDVRFTPDGRFAINATARGIQLLDAQRGDPMSPVCTTWSGALPSLVISSDGRWALIGGDIDFFAVVDLHQLMGVDKRSSQQVLCWAELLSNSRVNGSTVVNLTPNEWLERWQQFRREYPDFRPFDTPMKP
jgi:serine/threonine protein kinase/WD40 repeat protein